MGKKEVTEKFEELASWFENMTREGIDESMQIIGRMLASLPGGDEFEDLGFEPYDWLGWLEYQLITDALQSVGDKWDVEDAASILFDEDEEED